MRRNAHIPYLVGVEEAGRGIEFGTGDVGGGKGWVVGIAQIGLGTIHRLIEHVRLGTYAERAAHKSRDGVLRTVTQAAVEPFLFSGIL